jgi:hypothetical protein
MRTLAGLGGRGCLNVYRSALGGFQKQASYMGETDRSCVTRVIHAGMRSTRTWFVISEIYKPAQRQLQRR